MKNALLATAALLVAALATWPAVAGDVPVEVAAPEAAAPAEVLEPVAAEAPPADLLIGPAKTALPMGSCNCPDVYDPVCGSDGVTYPNACVAGCNGVRSYTEGACGSTS